MTTQSKTPSFVGDVQSRLIILLAMCIGSLEKELAVVERQVYNLEKHYLEETSATGNVVRGWDAYKCVFSLPNTLPRLHRTPLSLKVFCDD